MYKPYPFILMFGRAILNNCNKKANKSEIIHCENGFTHYNWYLSGLLYVWVYHDKQFERLSKRVLFGIEGSPPTLFTKGVMGYVVCSFL